MQYRNQLLQVCAVGLQCEDVQQRLCLAVFAQFGSEMADVIEKWWFLRRDQSSGIYYKFCAQDYKVFFREMDDTSHPNTSKPFINLKFVSILGNVETNLRLSQPWYCCSHIWDGAPNTTLKVLNTVQKRAVHLVNNPTPADPLQSLSQRYFVLSSSFKSSLHQLLCPLLRSALRADTTRCSVPWQQYSFALSPFRRADQESS